jgi:hypothetical protein
VNSATTRRFWTLFHALPGNVQQLATRNYQLWCRDPNHPSLRFRRLQGTENLFTIRVGDHYRALGTLTANTVTWIWIGAHAEYDRLVGS